MKENEISRENIADALAKMIDAIAFINNANYTIKASRKDGLKGVVAREFGTLIYRDDVMSHAWLFGDDLPSRQN